MIYLSGVISQTLLANPRPDLGLMVQPGMGTYDSKRLEFATRWWGADNGRYAAADKWDPGDWLEWAASMRRWRSTCLFMVAPDVVGDAAATLELSRPYLPTIRQLGFPAAFVAQDGFDPSVVDPDSFDVLFVGGLKDNDRAWKFAEDGGYAAARWARGHGKRTHMGRVNSFTRFSRCRVSLFNSGDGTYAQRSPDLLMADIYRWLDQSNGQTFMEVA